MASDLGHDVSPAGPPEQAFDPGALPGIRQSAASLARDQDAFIEQFYADTSALVPASAVPPAFDTRAFCDRMGRALLWAALTDQPATAIADALRQLGAQNWYVGFPDSQYPSVARALVQAVRYLTVNTWSASTGSAWIGFFMWVKPHLLAGAQDAAAYDSAARDAAASESAAQHAAEEEEKEEVEERPGLGQIMLGMTRSRLRNFPRRQS